MIFLFRKKRSIGANNRFVTVRLYACNEYKIITVVIKTGIDVATRLRRCSYTLKSVFADDCINYPEIKYKGPLEDTLKLQILLFRQLAQ